MFCPGHGLALNGRVRCLIIDDDESVRSLMERLLVAKGNQVTACSRPVEAIAAAVRNPCDIAIVDLELPEMNGAGAGGTEAAA